jgi:DNA-binding NarL/FixJ family response regulator
MAKLLLVEDHTMFRAGIRALVERSTSGHVIVGEASDGLAAARLAQEFSPEVVLMDISMPKLNGIETTRLLARECPATRVVMLSMHADPAFVFAALDAGASAYLLKDAAFSELEAAIRAAMTGQKYLCTGLRTAVRPSEKPEAGPGSGPLTKLSPRERQVLQLIGEAYTSAEIAEHLGLRRRTVETYRQALMNKLELHSAAALTAFAIKHGICSSDVGAKPQSAAISP